MLSVRDALERMLPHFQAMPPERVPLACAAGRALSEPLAARTDLPLFDHSAMDGYAVRSADLASASTGAPVTLPVVGESRAGCEPPPLAPRTVMRILTGAPLPLGADAVVMQEDAPARGDGRLFQAPVPGGAHVRARASDVRAGTTLLELGHTLAAGEIALCAAQGYAALPVHARPRVAIVSTGDELREPGEPLGPGCIVNSNAPALAALVEDAGGVPMVLPTAPDEPVQIAARLREALVADVVLTSGGVSVGDHDHVQAALDRLGLRTEFWKVAVKPGKPLLFASSGGAPVVGLPGNPVSAMVTFELFVRPGLRQMLGHRARFRPEVPVTMRAPVSHRPGRTELVRARVDLEGGRFVATPHRLQGSGSLPSMVGLDALLILDAARGDAAAGEVVPALWLVSGQAAEAHPFR